MGSPESVARQEVSRKKEAQGGVRRKKEKRS